MLVSDLSTEDIQRMLDAKIKKIKYRTEWEKKKRQEDPEWAAKRREYFRRKNAERRNKQVPNAESKPE